MWQSGNRCQTQEERIHDFRLGTQGSKVELGADRVAEHSPISEGRLRLRLDVSKGAINDVLLGFAVQRCVNHSFYVGVAK